MALRPCPDCGNQVSDAAPACPKCGRPFAPSGPVAVTAQSPIPVVVKPRTGCVPMGCAVLLVVGAVTSIVAVVFSDSKPTQQALVAPKPVNSSPLPQPSNPPQVTQSSAQISPNNVAPHMTKISIVHGIPTPEDGKESGGATKTKIGTVAELTAFYRNWMAAHRWTFDAKNSVMDPAVGVAKSLGFTTSQVWCKRTKPITTVSIIVGSGDNTDRGKSAQISIQSLPYEDSCP